MAENAEDATFLAQAIGFGIEGPVVAGIAGLNGLWHGYLAA
jgi:hypothetical protein